MNASGIALSGLNAARTQVGVSASNIANMRSVGVRDAADTQGFRPQRVSLQSDAAGGVQANVVPVDPASVPSFEPQNPAADADGIVPRPNISLERELVDLKIAEHSFGSNLRVLQTEDAMMRSLLDIIA